MEVHTIQPRTKCMVCNKPLNLPMNLNIKQRLDKSITISLYHSHKQCHSLFKRQEFLKEKIKKYQDEALSIEYKIFEKSH